MLPGQVRPSDVGVNEFERPRTYAAFRDPDKIEVIGGYERIQIFLADCKAALFSSATYTNDIFIEADKNQLLQEMRKHGCKSRIVKGNLDPAT